MSGIRLGGRSPIDKVLYRAVKNDKHNNRQNYPWMVDEVVVHGGKPISAGKPVAFVSSEKLALLYSEQMNRQGYLEIFAW